MLLKASRFYGIDYDKSFNGIVRRMYKDFRNELTIYENVRNTVISWDLLISVCKVKLQKHLPTCSSEFLLYKMEQNQPYAKLAHQLSVPFNVICRIRRQQNTKTNLSCSVGLGLKLIELLHYDDKMEIVEAIELATKYSISPYLDFNYREIIK